MPKPSLQKKSHPSRRTVVVLFNSFAEEEVIRGFIPFPRVLVRN